MTLKYFLVRVITVWIAEEITPFIREDSCHASQKLTEINQCNLFFKVDAVELEVLWLTLHWGGNFEISEPDWLREEAINTIIDMNKRFKINSYNYLLIFSIETKGGITMSAVFFKPWIGDNYASSSMFGKKILVLGEAHYQWDANIPLKPELTQDCIIEQITTDYTKQFWTNIAVAFLSKKPTQEEKREFWHSVAFYNYIQASVGFGPRVRPPKEMWGQSEPGFIEVMNDLTPDVLIVLGYELWKNLPALQGEDGPLIVGAEQPNTRYYPLVSGGTCLAYAVRHPTAGFSGRYWHHHIKQAISLSSGIRHEQIG